MSNFIPEAGIWMNTQRPEWNDANNALVGNGVSMVTLYYLRRFLKFFQQILDNSNQETIKISNEMVEFYHAVRENLMQFSPLLKSSLTDTDRKTIMDALGKAASDYRFQVYHSGFWGKKRTHSMQGLKNFIQVCLDFIEHSIQINKRPDNLYHAYNLISIHPNRVSISYLPEMLEGQVAVLSSKYLSAQEALDNLNALRKSDLYREDQNSYLLYPNKELPKFLEKNNLPHNKVADSKLLLQLLNQNNSALIDRDIHGNFHFNGNFHNANDLNNALNELEKNEKYTDLVASDREKILDLFEDVFVHKAFTGRSGTFYGYEGLGSIYWHMVSKLHLAVEEVCQLAVENQQDTAVVKALQLHFDEIAAGIGIHKSPKTYGAFPTDPYSHTPWHRGAQQPGMTGQVKEDILTRVGELGVKISHGKISFQPALLQKKEFLGHEKNVTFVGVDGSEKNLSLPKDSLAFSFCQIPVLYTINSMNQIQLDYASGEKQIVEALELNSEQSRLIFLRTNQIVQITVLVTEDKLR